MIEHVNSSVSVSCGFMSSVVNLLPFRLRELFLDKLGKLNLLDTKDQWLDKLVKFIERRVNTLESGLMNW